MTTTVNTTTSEQHQDDLLTDYHEELVRNLRIELKVKEDMLQSGSMQLSDVQQQYSELLILQKQQQSQLEAIQQANLKLQQELQETHQDLEQSRRDVICLSGELQQYANTKNQNKLEEELNGIESSNNSNNQGMPPTRPTTSGSTGGEASSSDWFVLPREVRQLQEQLKRCRTQQTKLTQAHSLEVESLVTQLQEAQTRSNYHEQQLREHLLQTEKTTIRVRKEHDQQVRKLGQEYERKLVASIKQQRERQLARRKPSSSKSVTSSTNPATNGGGGRRMSDGSSDEGATTSSTGSESGSSCDSDDFLDLLADEVVTFTRAEWSGREAAQEKTIQKLMAKIEDLEETVSKQKHQHQQQLPRPPLIPPSSPGGGGSVRTTNSLTSGWPSLPGFSRHGSTSTFSNNNANISSNRSVMTMPGRTSIFTASMHG
uniref:Uncharacterized protein n=1 Tax=Grammatophora oceanica TaxID=210454 RepID=A0A7S1VDW6_9STRA|eukprot:CAMPEP_0194053474 /NCGR_PEP_ID=MMETSP0009_2-20130614/49990_1 /TAXON_ID=210454 /ORGANISM="Grammatophora oceanica, Strain CCMP 410" /LENGTH=428 /DNA_ID=CAMNT_0038701581 /DNA_START=28 /DNA_END=1317 /DNA_ORIENTATION=-